MAHDHWLTSLPDPIPETTPVLRGFTRDKVRQVLRQGAAISDETGQLYYIPLSYVRNAFTRDAIARLLGLLLGAREEGIPDLATFIVPDQKHCTACNQPHCTGRRLLFLGLIAIAQEADITKFHKTWSLEEKNSQDTCDYKLAPKVHAVGTNPESSRDDLTANWTPAEMETVRRLFWRVQSYRFTSENLRTRPRCNPATNSSKIYPWAKVDDNVTLPWTKLPDEPVVIESPVIESPAHTGTGMESLDEPKSLSKEGQFSTVDRVRIHPDYNGLGGPPDTDYALKALKLDRRPLFTRQAFQKEIDANKRAAEHPRVVTFQTVFEHRGTHYLLLPWATGGSLKTLWKNLAPARDGMNPRFPHWCTSEWLLDQCLGLAEGLAHMHSADRQVDDQDLVPSTCAQIHLDVKPENILAFLEKDGSYTLKLGDLGLSHELDKERSVPMSYVIGALSYRPPERDLGKDRALVQWDTWSLGCVLLELVTWYLSGYDGVKRFRKMRNEEVNDPRLSFRPPAKETTFFRLKLGNPWMVWILGVGMVKSAEVKVCVREHIRKLKTLHRCDKTLQRLLDCVEDRMLVTDDNQRAIAIKVCEKLTEIMNSIEGLDGPTKRI